MLAESAIQKATKFHHPHFLRSGSTGSDQNILRSTKLLGGWLTWAQVMVG